MPRPVARSSGSPAPDRWDRGGRPKAGTASNDDDPADCFGCGHILLLRSPRKNELTGGRRRIQRQQTLVGVIDWSHDLLAEDDQLLFRPLAVFAGSFGIDAAEVIFLTVPLK